MEILARRFLVTGRVQGVGFRWFVVDAAEGLNVAGWTRNLPDGSVEVVAQGERETLDALRNVLAEGPRSARVQNVTWEQAAIDPALKGFRVRH